MTKLNGDYYVQIARLATPWAESESCPPYWIRNEIGKTGCFQQDAAYWLYDEIGRVISGSYDELSEEQDEQRHLAYSEYLHQFENAIMDGKVTGEIDGLVGKLRWRVVVDLRKIDLDNFTFDQPADFQPVDEEGKVISE